MTALLELHGIETFYGPVQVHFGFDLEVRQGQIVCLLGGNASGKSTTMKVILGLVRPRAGQVRFDGEAITGRPTPQIIRRGIGSVPEARRIFPVMTVRENLMMGAYTRRDRSAIAEDLDRVLGLFPRLRERLAQRGGTLSGGEQQMLAIGRALMTRPRLMLLDEPSLGLAPILVEQIFATITEINAQGVTVLLVEQNALQALSTASRGYVLQTGRVVLAGTSEDLLRNEMVRKAYLGEA